MDIEGLGDKLVDQLVDQKLLGDLDDLYRLTREQVASLERMADKSAFNLIEAVERSKEISLERFYFGLGIRHVGEHLARVLARRYPDVRELMSATEEELTAIRDVGPKVAQAIVSFFQDTQNRRVVQSLLELGVRPMPPVQTEAAASPFQGKSVVFTGALQSMTRQDAETLVERLGGRAASSVSARTDLVVAGPGAGTKLVQAKKLGIRAVSEEEFMAMIPKSSS